MKSIVLTLLSRLIGLSLQLVQGLFRVMWVNASTGGCADVADLQPSAVTFLQYMCPSLQSRCTWTDFTGQHLLYARPSIKHWQELCL